LYPEAYLVVVDVSWLINDATFRNLAADIFIRQQPLTDDVIRSHRIALQRRRVSLMLFLLLIAVNL
jgi:hypothetical protein